MADKKVQVVHPVTGFTKTISNQKLDEYVGNGWLDGSPVQRKDNFHPAARKNAEQQEEAAAQDAAKVSTTTAADPGAAGLRADGGPSEG